ncbi:MAG: ATP synthase F1 subunit gamma [Candidatus Falkowbacteria bacterium]
MAQTKEISRRIKSIASTKKITKAMEMVAAAKMRKASEAVLKTRAYAHLSWETILNLSRLAQSKNQDLHPLLSKRAEVKRVAVILITSNRGLCGGFNAAIINKVRDAIQKDGLPADMILVGRKGAILHNQGYEVVAEFPKADLLVNSNETNPIALLAIADFLSGKYDKVLLAYTDFVSPVKQVPRVKQLLPVEMDSESEDEELTSDYTFEPSPSEVLNLMIPKLVEVQLYQALLESNAAEHSARMTSMHQATEAATDMVSELTLYYNKARQASITAEIAEISAGANALNE